MKSRCGTTIRALAVAAILGSSPAFSQDATIETLIELAQNDAASDFIGLPGAELAGILGGADAEQRSALIAALSPADVDAILAALARDGSAPRVLADLFAAVITDEPDAVDRIVSVVLQNAPPVVLPQIADALFEIIERDFAEMSLAVLEAHVFAALSFDRRIAARMAAFGNSLDETNAARLARVLVTISENSDPLLASAIEAALALEGGQIARLAAEFRGELAVAAIPGAQPLPPAAPPVPPAGIGGGGAAGGDTGATGAGIDAVFAAGGSGGGGLSGGPSFTPETSFTPPAAGPVTSPTN